MHSLPYLVLFPPRRLLKYPFLSQTLDLSRSADSHTLYGSKKIVANREDFPSPAKAQHPRASEPVVLPSLRDELCSHLSPTFSLGTAPSPSCQGPGASPFSFLCIIPVLPVTGPPPSVYKRDIISPIVSDPIHLPCHPLSSLPPIKPTGHRAPCARSPQILSVLNSAPLCVWTKGRMR